MMKLFAVLAIVLVSRPCSSRSVTEPEESVVSVYTAAGTTPRFDVYHQIANNIAERITSPIYRFLGIGSNKTESEEKTTKKPWDKIENLDISEEASKTEIKPVDNNISEDRDIEELSVEALRKPEKKPEKITLYSSYLPVKENIDRNDTVNEISDDSDDDDDGFGLDDVDNDDDFSKPREGPFVFFLEILGSIVQLVWGGITALFSSSNSSNSSSGSTS